MKFVLPWRVGAAFSLAALMLLGLSAPSLQAQSTTQAIQGLVTDATGAVIPGATVSYMNLATGVSASVQSNETGNFTFTLVPVGNYEVSCQMDGFKTETVTEQRVETGAQVRLNFQLEIGDVTETIEISAAAVTLNTENATVGSVIENKRIVELPLNGRNIVQLAVLVPGVTFGQRSGMADGQGGFPIPGASYSVNGNGVRELHQVVSLDGVDAKDPRIHITPFVPSIEAIEEFKITTNSYNAEVGFGGGAVTNITMKSGTNDFHGTVFHFLRNESLDAEPYFLNFERPASSTREKNKRRRNQFGGFVSGPIVKNKTFWAFNFEGRVERLTRVNEGWFPHDTFRRGDFSELISDSYLSLGKSPIVVYDAFTGNPYPNNIIPTSDLHPGTVNNFIPQLIPSADFREPDPLDETVRKGIVSPVDSDLYFGRVDHHISDVDRVFARIAIDDSQRPGPTLNPNFNNAWIADTTNLATQWIHTFNQNAINELRFGFSFSNNDLVHPRTNDESFDMDDFEMGIYRVFGDGNRRSTPFEQGIVDFLGTRMPRMRDNSITNKLDSLQIGDHISVIKGSHNFKFGGEIYRISIERAAANLPMGRVEYGANESGFNFASFILGRPRFTNTMEGVPFTFPRGTRQGYYVHDDWKVNQKLTVNLGLRVEYLGNPHDIKGLWRTVNFVGEDSPEGRDGFNGAGYLDPLTGQTVASMGPTFVDERGGGVIWKQDFRFFMPRVGIAYRPTEKWVVRAGAGWYANLMHQNNFTILNLNPPKSGSLRFDSVTDGPDQDPRAQTLTIGGQTARTRVYRDGVDVLSLADPFLEAAGGTAVLKNVDTLHVKPDYKDGDVWKWSLDVQRELPQNLALTVGYVGNSQYHIANSFRNWNSPFPSSDSNIQANRPFPRFFDEATPELGVQGLAVIRYLDSYGSGSHHGLQMKLDKRYSSGVSFGVAYTFSKTLGNGEAGGNQHANHQNPRLDRARSYGRLRFDQTHNMVTHFVWEMPGGNLPGALKHIVGNWQTNGILSLRSGFPYRITQGRGDLNVSDLTTTRPDGVGNPIVSNPNRKLWYNPQAYSRVTCRIPEQPELCRFGNIGYQPSWQDSAGQKNLDFGLFKNIPITEGLRVQFRAEFFNAFNTPYFGGPRNISFSSSDITSPDGSRDGEIRGVRTPERIVQFALKIFF